MQPTDDRNSWYEGKGLWSDVPDTEWNDWKWQMRNRITKQSDLDGILALSSNEIAGFSAALNRLSVGITPYFLNLVDPADPLCPIRRQVIPSIEESDVSDIERKDPVGEELDMVVPGLVHRYPDRVLFLVTDRCASYCRYCTRSRMVSNAQDYGFSPSLQAGLEYIKSNTAIRDVLLSGGDPLLLSDEKLAFLLTSLSEIPHVEFVRIGSRVPVFMPQRITPSLLRIFSESPNLWISLHVNHPLECTLSLRDATHKLAKCGIPLGNQSVLLKGVNDNLEIMKSLVHRLLMMKIKPYYLYQCDLIKGSSHLRTNVSKGIEIIKGLRGHTSGYAVPQFVIDSPNGGGKIPLSPDYASFQKDGSLIINDFKGNQYTYPNLSHDTLPIPIVLD